MGQRIHSVKFNAVLNMILSSSSMIFPLITIPYASRILQPSGIGAVSFAQSVASYFSLVALLGVQMYGVRACAQVRDDPRELARVVEELLIILASSTTIIFLIYIASVLFIPLLAEDRLLFMVFGLVLWLASFGAEWFYQAIEQYGYITIRSIAFKFIGLLLMFFFVHKQSDYVIYGGIVVFTGYGANILNMFRLRTLVTFRPLKELNIRRHFKPMSSFLISSISSGMYAQADLVILGFLTSNTVVGVYQLVAKVKSMLCMAINSVVNVMLPRLSYYVKKSPDKYYDLLVKNINFVLLLAFEGIGAASLCAEPIVMLLGGSQYKIVTIPLLCILPALLFASLNTTLSQYLISIGKERKYALVNFTGLVSAIVYCFICIPLWGASGAAMACSLCEFTALIMRCWCSKDFLKKIYKSIEVWQSLISAGIAFCLTFGIRCFISFDNPIIEIAWVGSIYSIFYVLLLFIFRETFVRSFWKIILNKTYGRR